MVAVKRSWPYVVIVLISLLLTAPLASTRRWPSGHDGLRYHFLLDHFRDSVQHGNVYPRFLPNAFGGYGYPTFLFYQPGFFFAALPFALVVDNLVLVVYLTILLLFIVGGIGAYQLCLLLGDQLAALFGACLFLLTPYVSVNLYVRNDLAELMAMLLTPWALYSLMRLVRATAERRNPVAAMMGLAGFVTLILASHPATALFFMPALCFVGIYLGATMRDCHRKFLIRAASSVLLGVVLAAPYWTTLFQMKSHVVHQFAIGGYFTSTDHVVYPSQLFSPAWGFGLSLPGSDDGMSFQLGLPHFLMALAGAIVLRRTRIVQASFIAYVVLILLMMPASKLLWEKVSILHYVQFPWRILSVTAVFQLVCAIGIVQFARMANWEKLSLCLGLLLSCATWNLNQFSTGPESCERADIDIRNHRREWLNAFHTYSAADEFTPHTAVHIREIGTRRDRPLVELAGPERSVMPAPGNSPYLIQYRIGPGPVTNLTINQIYIPGWCVRINNAAVERSVLEQDLLPDGRIRLAVADTGPVELQAYYAGPPFHQFRNAFIFGFVIFFTAYCIREYRTVVRHSRSIFERDRPVKRASHLPDDALVEQEPESSCV